VAIGALAFCASAAVAQQSGADTSAASVGATTDYKLEEVVVTAEKHVKCRY
jgi:hypothetical protein